VWIYSSLFISLGIRRLRQVGQVWIHRWPIVSMLYLNARLLHSPTFNNDVLPQHIQHVKTGHADPKDQHCVDENKFKKRQLRSVMYQMNFYTTFFFQCSLLFTFGQEDMIWWRLSKWAFAWRLLWRESREPWLSIGWTWKSDWASREERSKNSDDKQDHRLGWGWKLLRRRVRDCRRICWLEATEEETKRQAWRWEEIDW
jgi:hypothetical protein